MSHGSVLYDFTATEPDELSVAAGDEVELLMLNGDSWWLAKKGEEVGLIPENYVCIEMKGSGTSAQKKIQQKKTRQKAADELIRIKEERLQADAKIEKLRNTLTSIENPSSDISNYQVATLPPAPKNSDFDNLIVKLESTLDDYSGGSFSKNESNLYKSLKSIVNKCRSKDAISLDFYIDPKLSLPETSSNALVSIPSIRSSSIEALPSISPIKISDSPTKPTILASASNANFANNVTALPSNSLEGIRYPFCRSIVYRPTIIGHEPPSTVPSQSLRLQHIYSFCGMGNINSSGGVNGGGSSIGSGGVGGNNIGSNVGNSNAIPTGNSGLVMGLDHLALYPSASLVIGVDLSTGSQCFFSGHNDTVTAISTHPSRCLAASGQLGRPARVLVWDYSFLRMSRDSRAENNVVADLVVTPSDGKGVQSLSFSGDGRFLLAMAMDDAHTISIFDWAAGGGIPIASAKLGHPEVSNVAFNPHLFVPIDRVYDHQTQSPLSPRVGSKDLRDPSESGCYTIVSCGGRQVKFWTLTRVSMTGESQTDSPEDKRAFRGRQLHMPKHRQVVQVKYELVGNAGAAPRSSADVEFSSLLFVRDSHVVAQSTSPSHQTAGRRASRIFTGTLSGSIYIWQQLEDQTAGPVLVGSQSWYPRGRLLSVVTDVHDTAIVDMAYYTHNLSPISQDRVVTCGRDGLVQVWSVSHGDAKALPLEPAASINIDGLVTGNPGVGQNGVISGGYARSLAIDCSTRDLIVGTSQGTLLRLADLGKEVEDKSNGIRVLCQGHVGRVRGVSAHPRDAVFATISQDRSLRIWDAVSRLCLLFVRLPFVPSCVGFSPAGDTLVVGSEGGEVTTWKVALENRASPKSSVSISLEQDIRKNVSAKTSKQDSSSPSKGGPSRRFEVVCVRFSPQEDILAVGCRDNLIHFLSLKQSLRRLAVCRGHSTNIRSMDFSDDGSTLQSCDSSRELLFWEVPSGRPIKNAGRVRDLSWASLTCLYGWSVQGIFNEDSSDNVSTNPAIGNGNNVNSVSNSVEHFNINTDDVLTACRSHSRDLIATGGAGSRPLVKLFNYPCLAAARPRQYTGHASSVLDVKFLSGDKHLISVGGNDMSIFQWELFSE